MANGKAPVADPPEDGTTETAPRRGRPPGSKNGSGTAKAKAEALYHIYSKDNKSVLTPVGNQKAKTAAQAAQRFLKKPPSGQATFAKNVLDGKATVVVIPERNQTEVGASEEVRRSVKLKVVK